MTPDPATDPTIPLPSGVASAGRPTGGEPALAPTAQFEGPAAPHPSANPVPLEQTRDLPSSEAGAPEGATFPGGDASGRAEASEPAPAGDPPAGPPVAPKVWTAADAPRSASEQSRKVNVGQLIWGCIVALLGVFIIAIPFIDLVDLPLVLIGLVGILGLSLIGASLVVGKGSKQ